MGPLFALNVSHLWKGSRLKKAVKWNFISLLSANHLCHA